MPTANRNGYFGPVTVEAVKAFQKARGLEQTGDVTKVEWQALADS
ncbi:MAG: peptidoglycan-binding protein [Actinomycetota bacterium]|nr:peptidoglycan-binding protein [Actinomycetota bacterium]